MTSTLFALMFLGIALAVILFFVFFKPENLMVGRVYGNAPHTLMNTIKMKPTRSLAHRGRNIFDDIKENVIPQKQSSSESAPEHAHEPEPTSYSVNIKFVPSHDSSITGNWSKRREIFQGDITHIPYHRDSDKMTKT